MNKVYNHAFELFGSLDLSKWNDAYPTLKEKYDALPHSDDIDFSRWYAPDAGRKIPEVARSHFKGDGLWDKKVNASSVEHYNSVINDVVWETVDGIIDELIKYLGIKPDRRVTHGEAVA